jgi:hypothetical protein
VELTTTSEAVSRSVTQEFPNILRKQKVRYRVNKSPPQVPIPSKMNSVHNASSCFSKIHFNSIGFEVLTAVVVESSIFWDITPCSQLKVNQRFGRTYRLHLQGRRSALLTTCVHVGFLLGLFFDPEDRGDMFH